MSGSELKFGWTGWVLLIVAVAAGTAYFYRDWQRQNATRDKTRSAFNGPPPAPIQPSEWTLPSEGGTMVLVRSEDGRRVAEAVVGFYAAQGGGPWRVVVSSNMAEPGPQARFFVNPPYGGCVEIDGPMAWDEKKVRETMDLARELSGALKTVAVAALIGPGAETGAFGVFEAGERVFWVRRTEAGVKHEGAAWAERRGLKASGGRFERFTMRDANAFAHQLGCELSKAPVPDRCWVVEEGRRSP